VAFDPYATPLRDRGVVAVGDRSPFGARSRLDATVLVDAAVPWFEANRGSGAADGSDR